MKLTGAQPSGTSRFHFKSQAKMILDDYAGLAADSPDDDILQSWIFHYMEKKFLPPAKIKVTPPLFLWELFCCFFTVFIKSFFKGASP